jgi:hypothetical protein
MPTNPRLEIIHEMMQTFVQAVSAERAAAYYKRLEDVSEDVLRAACVGCVEQGQQRGMPTVAEIRRRANEISSSRSALSELEDPTPRHRECRKAIHHTRFGSLLCCREEGHIGDCEAWFSREGVQPADAEGIAQLVRLGDGAGPLADELEEIPF